MNDYYDDEPDQEQPNAEEYVRLDELTSALEFIELIKNATLDESDLDKEVLHRLRNPLREPPVVDKDDFLSLETYLAVYGASESTYTKTRDAFLRRHPNDTMLTLSQVKSKLVELTGVAPIMNDMCPNACMAYTGPWKHLETCRECGEPRYDPIAFEHTKKKISRQQFPTIPIGPQIQSLFRDPENAYEIRYRDRRTKEIIAEIVANNGKLPIYDDLLCGEEYLEAIKRGDIGKDDVVVMNSIDGAQLYKNKQSDCWIGIWVVVDHKPEVRYKKVNVLPNIIIPGPNKPKNVDSFLFPGVHHLGALQNEGLKIWDAYEKRECVSKIFLYLGMADGPGMTYLNGLTGHHGAYGCRLYCATKGRLKGTHYYAAHLKPDGYTVHGSDHDDIDIQRIPPTSPAEYQENLRYVLRSENEAQFKIRRRETGICKPSIFSGLHENCRLPIPTGFAGDLMHLAALNIPDLVVGMITAKFDCDPLDDKATWDWAVYQGQVWIDHGKRVADALSYLPGSFGRPPRNIAEKLNSGYKAWEFILWLYGLGPGFFYGILPEKYWVHICKVIRAMRLMHQKRIFREQMAEAHRLFITFVHEFELMYYQRKPERIHFCRQSLHSLLHIVPESLRVGPQAYCAQWAMENAIGNLGMEIKQPSQPFANLAQRAILRCQTNALKAIIPELEPDNNHLPRGSRDVGDRFVFLRAREKYPQKIEGAGKAVIRSYVETTADDGAPRWCDKVRRWARVRLPNGQVARSAWKEELKPKENVRMARMVKVRLTFELYTCSN